VHQIHREQQVLARGVVVGQQPQKFEKLPCDPKCKELQWLGFVSNATEKAVFFVDNVKLVTKQVK